MVITSKLIKIKSSGRYETSSGPAIIGPQVSFYKESVSEIGHLLTRYPKIDIVEKIEDGRLVRLTMANYDKNNNAKSKPVSVETPEPQQEKVEEPKPETNPMGAVNTTPEADKEPENPVSVETPEPQQEKVEEPKPETNQQQYSGKNKKNKNKNDHQQQAKSTEVTPEEPKM